MMPRRGTKEYYMKKFEPGEREAIHHAMEKARMKRKMESQSLPETFKSIGKGVKGKGY